MPEVRPHQIDCDVSALGADIAVIDALARLQVGAKRLGLELRLRGASNELQQLAAFAGLGEVLGIETCGQAEEREERLGIEEEGELGDPAG
jgi:hypothetical protein